MKKIMTLLTAGLLLSAPASFAQERPKPSVPSTGGGGGGGPSQEELQAALPHFDLDFKGGTPAQLVAAIEKAMSKPLNVIIPDEHADAQLPPLKMRGVTVPQLFFALEQASARTVAFISGWSLSGGQFGGKAPNYSQTIISLGFQTQTPYKEDAIWSFFRQQPPKVPNAEIEAPQKVCRFWQLASYLDAGYTIDDITTAIDTGWKMLGETPPPKVNFHKDTRLLIAVGLPEKLRLIDQVLEQLSRPKNPKEASEDTKSTIPTRQLKLPPGATTKPE